MQTFRARRAVKSSRAKGPLVFRTDIAGPSARAPWGHYRAQEPLSGIGAGDVTLEGLDDVILAGDDPADEVAHGDDADHGVTAKNGHVAEVMAGHHGHAFIHRLLGRDVEDGAAHELADERLFRVEAAQYAFAGVVALGEDADETLVGHDEQGSHVVAGHQLKRFVNGLLRFEREDLRGPLALEHLADGVGDFHRNLLAANNRDGGNYRADVGPSAGMQQYSSICVCPSVGISGPGAE